MTSEVYRAAINSGLKNLNLIVPEKDIAINGTF